MRSFRKLLAIRTEGSHCGTGAGQGPVIASAAPFRGFPECSRALNNAVERGRDSLNASFSPRLGPYYMLRRRCQT